MRKNEFITRAGDAFHRAKMYRIFSYFFFHPGSDFLRFLRSGEGARELNESFRACALRAGGDGIMPLWDQLLQDLERISGDGDPITEEYIRFLTLKSSCSPYEADYYRSSLAVFSADDMADVAGFYRAFGMDFSIDRPDYIGTELEFMYLAVLRESEAAVGKEREKAVLCGQIQKKFMEEHLGRWIQAFAEALETAKSSFYSVVAALLSLWIDRDCLYLGAVPQKVRPFYLSLEEEDPIALCGKANQS